MTIANKQNHNVIDYIESNHDYNRDYICLETSQNEICMVWCEYIFRQHTILMNAINEITNL